MNEDLELRIKMFFDYWRERYNFITGLTQNTTKVAVIHELPLRNDQVYSHILRKSHINNLDKTKHSHEANVLLWESFDALSNLWAKNIGEEECSKRNIKTKRLIFDAFLARYGGDLFKIVSLPDVWDRVDQKKTQKLSDDVSKFLGKIGGRQTFPSIDIKDQRTTRQTSDDLYLDDLINATLAEYPNTNRTKLEEWLTLSRYGAIAYKEMRSAYIHEGQPGKGTHDFDLFGSSTKPTYSSWKYSTPPIIGFKVEFMLCVLKRCIDEFEAEALALKKDPVPENDGIEYLDFE